MLRKLAALGTLQCLYLVRLIIEGIEGSNHHAIICILLIKKDFVPGNHYIDVFNNDCFLRVAHLKVLRLQS